MKQGNSKKGRESKKPKQSGSKSLGKSDYQSRQSDVVAAPFKAKKG